MIIHENILEPGKSSITRSVRRNDESEIQDNSLLNHPLNWSFSCIDSEDYCITEQNIEQVQKNTVHQVHGSDINRIAPPVYKTAGIVEYSSHAPITVDGNTDFANQAIAEGWNKSGSGPPYIISSYNFTGTGVMINITNTDYSFEIRDNYFNTDDAVVIDTISADRAKVINNTVNASNTGITVINATGTVIANNTIQGSFTRGIDLSLSNYSILTGNNITASTGEAIYLKTSAGVSVNNSFIDSSFNGIYFDNDCNESIIAGNVLVNASNFGIYSCSRVTATENSVALFQGSMTIGIYFESTGFTGPEAFNNHVENGTLGIYIYGNSGGFDCSVEGNAVESCDYGIVLSNTGHNEVNANTIYSCNTTGIVSNDSNNNTISENNITSCGSWGVVLDLSEDNLISYNTFSANAGNINSTSTCSNNTFIRNTLDSSQITGIPDVRIHDITNGSALQDNESGLYFNVTGSLSGILYYQWEGESTSSCTDPWNIPLPSVEGSYTLNISAVDADDEWVIFIYEFYINYSPEFINTPDGSTISYHHAARWVVNDDNANTYSAFRDGQLMSSGSWANSKYIDIDLAGVPEGEYNFTVVLTDTYGRQAVNSSFVTVAEYTEFVPFTIDLENGDNLTEIADYLGWPGNGSETDPFIISWYKISNSLPDEPLIGLLGEVSGTSCFFIIEYNHLTSADYGITVTNWSNGTIRNNYISNMTYTAIFLSSCMYMSVTGNIVEKCDFFGITLMVGYTSIINNTVRFSSGGICMFDSGYSSILNNTIHDNDKGLILTKDSYDFTFNVTISGNHIYNNHELGLDLVVAVNITVVNNFFVNNQGYGVCSSEFTVNNFIYNNGFLNNGDNQSQAFDNSTGNFWYDSSASVGNL
ncbi:MAG: right-handed parallel beta-helix repeat-containing protein, partial [Candidatus Hodarchaeales archaeon]